LARPSVRLGSNGCQSDYILFSQLNSSGVIIKCKKSFRWSGCPRPLPRKPYAPPSAFQASNFGTSGLAPLSRCFPHLTRTEQSQFDAVGGPSGQNARTGPVASPRSYGTRGRRESRRLFAMSSITTDRFADVTARHVASVYTSQAPIITSRPITEPPTDQNPQRAKSQCAQSSIKKSKRRRFYEITLHSESILRSEVQRKTVKYANTIAKLTRCNKSVV